MSNRLGGKQGTAYTGTNANQPPNMHFNDRPPTTFDKFDVSVGDFWVDSSAPYNYSLWYLASLAGDPGSRGELAHWIPVLLGVTMINQINVDGNVPVFPLNGVVNMYGINGIDTTFVAPNTINIGLTNPITINTLLLGSNPPLAPGVLALEIQTGDVQIDAGNLLLPNTVAGSTAGCIKMGGSVMLRNYGTNNIFLGSSGNTTLTPAVAVANIGIGNGALDSLTTGVGNTAIGVGTLNVNTTGRGNIAIGGVALGANTSGSHNIGLGYHALTANTTASNNIAIGDHSLETNIIGTENIAIGINALNANTADSNIAIGYNALNLNMTGGSNVAIAPAALQANTTGANNIAIGITALFANTTADNNVAIGALAMAANTTGGSNTAVGTTSLRTNTTGANNVAVGINAMAANTTAANNVAVGCDALQANTTGTENVALGYLAMGLSVSGNRNTAIGMDALNILTSGSYNTACGRSSLLNLGTGSSNVALGYNAGVAYNAAETNNIVIGATGIVGDTNAIHIGDTPTGAQWTALTSCSIGGIRGVTTTLNDAIPVLISSTGQLGTVSSSRAYKENIADLGSISKSIYSLRPVSFNYKSDKSKRENYGLIAEEVDKEMPNLVVYNSQQAPETVRYLDLIPLMLNEMIKINGRITAIEERYGN